MLATTVSVQSLLSLILAIVS
eukprot:SAG11_NODE_20459_length_444_cov_4.800000_1_plen_20_part_01